MASIYELSAEFMTLWQLMEDGTLEDEALEGALDGTADYFPGRGGERCVAPFESGDKDYWETKLINNVWHTWCKYYKPK